MSILENVKLLTTTITKEELNSATFVIEPFHPGYGVTIGHALRRILLSSLKGAAITSVKIEEVTHEFSTIKGVKQDVVDIILNLKQIYVKSHSAEPVTLKLSKTGPAELTAKDFVKNSQVEILNPEAPVATLDKGAKLNMELTVEQGMGYVPVEKRKDEQLPLGTIAIDAIYNPIKKISYEIVNTRVGGMTNYDKLILNITTNGSITPGEALKNAVDVSIQYFNQIRMAGIFDVIAKKSKSVIAKNKFKSKLPKATKISKRTVKKK